MVLGSSDIAIFMSVIVRPLMTMRVVMNKKKKGWKKQTAVDCEDGAVRESALVLGPDGLDGRTVEHVGQHVALAVEDIAHGRLLELVAAEHLALGVPEGCKVRARHEAVAVALLKHEADDGRPRLLGHLQPKWSHELGLCLIPSVYLRAHM